jgi:hypothetical protein
MMFLERNLEQLTVVQRQLVEQNSSLKKEVAIAERKLIARNERIQSLENLLQDSQEKLTAANHRYVKHNLLQKASTNPSQLRSPTHSRKRASRSRKSRFNTRSRLTRQRRLLRWVRRRRFPHRQASSWRRCHRGRPRAPCHWQSSEAGHRQQWRIEQRQEDKLVLQPAIDVNTIFVDGWLLIGKDLRSEAFSVFTGGVLGVSTLRCLA